MRQHQYGSTSIMGEDSRGFVAGWFAGCAGLIASHPLDTVRVRIQTYGNGHSGTVQWFVDIVGKEKVKGLFKGIAYPLLGQAAINATVFGVESMVYRRLPNENENSLNVWNSAIAGCCAGAVQSIIVCPMELVKIRMQNQGIGKQHVSPMMRRMGVSVAAPAEGKLLQSYRGPLETTKHIVYSEGAQGMFKGWWLTIFREVPQFGIYFGTYAWIRLRLGSLIGVSPEDLGVIYLSLAGGMTGVVTWCWYPVDVIKSRFQNDGGKLKYSGVLDCMKKSVQSDGMGVFVKGLQPTLIRGFVNGFATFPVFTLVMRFLSK